MRVHWGGRRHSYVIDVERKRIVGDMDFASADEPYAVYFAGRDVSDEIRTSPVEVGAVEQRRQASMTRFASLPSPFTLADFDFAAQPSVDPKLVAELALIAALAEEIGAHLAEMDRVGWYSPSEWANLGVDDEIQAWARRALDGV